MGTHFGACVLRALRCVLFYPRSAHRSGFFGYGGPRAARSVSLLRGEFSLGSFLFLHHTGASLVDQSHSELARRAWVTFGVVVRRGVAARPFHKPTMCAVNPMWAGHAYSAGHVDFCPHGMPEGSLCPMLN